VEKPAEDLISTEKPKDPKDLFHKSTLLSKVQRKGQILPK